MPRAAGPDDVDLTTWPDLRDDIDGSLADHEARILAWHVAEQLVGWFGVERFEGYRGKEGLMVFGVDEVAALITAKLGPVWDSLPVGTIDRLHAEGSLGRPLTHPWDNTT